MSLVPELESVPIPEDVREYSRLHHLEPLLPNVIEVTRRVFPNNSLSIRLDADYILKSKKYILLTVYDIRLTDDLCRHLAEDWHYSLIDAIGPRFADSFRLKLEHVG